MQLRDIMTRRIVTVELDDRLREVKEIFDRMKFHHVLVVDEGRLLGVVSDRDLLRALSPFIDSIVESPRDAATLDKRVHQIATRKPFALGPDAPVDDAIALMLEQRVSCIPVVDDDARPVGIVTWRDVLAWVRDRRDAAGG